MRPPGWQESVKALGIVAVLSLTTLVPFAILYSNRAASLDAVQALEASHRPDLLRLPEIISFVILLMLASLVLRKRIPGREPMMLAAASFALMPIIVFNQQVITGRSLQPLHYEMFVANYSALIAVVVAAAAVFMKIAVPPIRIPRRALLWVAICAFEWGAYETFVATRRSMEFARRLDEARPVALRLEELARHDDGKGSQTRATVLSTDLLAADGLPTTAPQAVLWAPHMPVFSGVTASESKERFYQYLYYTGISAERLREILTNERQYGFVAGLFGFERAIKGLSLHYKPITTEELQSELDQYAKYGASFTHERAERTKLSYLIVPAEDEPNLANLDRWYERDKGERIKSYTLFRLSLRDAASLNEAQTTTVPRVSAHW
jgi:hypothetical protein